MTRIDHERGVAYYLAFDQLLAEAPLDDDGRPDPSRSRVARSDDPAEAARLAGIRAELLAGEDDT